MKEYHANRANQANHIYINVFTHSLNNNLLLHSTVLTGYEPGDVLKSKNTPSNKRKILIAVYVDDILMLGKPENNAKLVKELARRFKLINHGPVKSFLRLNVQRINDMIQLNQPAYIDRMAKRFQLTDSNPFQI